MSFVRLFLSLFSVCAAIIWKSSAVVGSQTLLFRCLIAIRETSAIYAYVYGSWDIFYAQRLDLCGVLSSVDLEGGEFGMGGWRV